MARINRNLVDSILNEIRLVVGENNESGSVSDELLLLLLNRAQEEAAQLLARNYVEPILTYEDVITTATQDYELPEDCFEERVLKMEFFPSGNNAAPYPMTRIDFESDEASSYSPNTTSTIPEAWMQIGTTRSVRIFPKPVAGCTLRMWYAKKPTDLVTSQGRIKSVVDATTLELDIIGDELTANQDEDGSHISIVDAQTGTIKAILEVSSVDTSTDTVSFSLAPISAQIEGVDIEACPDLTAMDIVGDYICLAPLTCIPIIRQPVLNFIKQYAIALVQNNLGAEHEVAYRALKEMQKFIESMDSGKETHNRVKIRSHAYGGNIPRRTWPRPQS